MDPTFSDLAQRLEAERHNLSYRRQVKPEQPVRVIEVVKTKRNAEREAKMFHAGRYAAGARDIVAIAADEWLQIDLSREGK
jgi:hypothetical protein